MSIISRIVEIFLKRIVSYYQKKNIEKSKFWFKKAKEYGFELAEEYKVLIN